MNFKELTLIGSRVYTHKQFGDALALADTLADELRQTITQVVPLSDAAGVFEMIATPSLNTVKVLVDCQS